MSDNTFATAAVARAVKLIRAGIDPHELRRQVHREHQELTAQGLARVLDIARQEIEQDQPGKGSKPVAPAAGAAAAAAGAS